MTDNIKNLFICDTGYDNGGGQTLAEQFSKYPNTVSVFRTKYDNDTEYSTINHLLELYDRYKPEQVIVNIVDHKKRTIEQLERILSYMSKHSTITMLVITRPLLNNKRYINNIITPMAEYVDRVYILTPYLRDKMSQYMPEGIAFEALDLNLYDFADDTPMPKSDRKPICVTPARKTAFKGVAEYLKNYSSKIKTKDSNGIKYCYMGGDYGIKNGKMCGVSPSMFELIDVSTKTPKEGYNILDYPVELDKLTDDINIFPRYHNRQFMRDSLCALYPIYIMTKDSDSHFRRHKGTMDSAIEYSLYELVDYGTPVILFKNFTDCIGMSDSHPFVVEYAEEIPEMVSYISKLTDDEYLRLTEIQKQNFVDYQNNTRKEIEKVLGV